MSFRNWVVLVLWVMVSQKVWANPEYLADEVPAPKSLQDVPNSFRDFRLIPRLREGRLLRNLIGEHFSGLSPMVREAQVTLEPRLTRVTETKTTGHCVNPWPVAERCGFSVVG